MKDVLESFWGYIIIVFFMILSTIYGFDRVKKLGYCFIRKYDERQKCDECKKTNVFR